MLRRTLLKGIAAGGVGLGALLKANERRGENLRSPDRPPFVAQPNSATKRDAVSDPSEGDYYVAPDGSDGNPGTKEEPFATVTAAVQPAGPGDVIYLRGGVYERKRSVRISGSSGTAREPIVLAGYPGETPIFSFRGPNPGGWNHLDEGGLMFMNVEHWIVRNLSVEDSPGEGIRLTSRSRNNVFENIATVNNNLSGFGVYDGSNENEIRDLVSVNNYDPENGGGDADGIVLSDVRDNTVRNASLYHNSDDGIDLWDSRSIIVDRCHSWNNGRGENGNGNGFKLGGGEENQAGGHDVRRCIAHNNRNTGFDHNGAGIEMEVYNNTAWNNSTNFRFSDANHRLRNNISYEGEVNLGSPVTEVRNTWNLGISRPGFESFFPKSSQFLHLLADSPCVDAGIAIDGLQYTGEAPDLGAYEYGHSEESS